MPFKSKAQQRWMFATNPEKAREWAAETKDIKHLPEKKHPEDNPDKKKLPPMKKKAEAAFFEKMARPEKGFYFRDMSGRDDANFFKKRAMLGFDNATGGMGGMGMSSPMPMGGSMNVSPSMGTGTPKKAPKTEKVSLGMTGKPVSGMGYRGEGMSGETKHAAPSPNDWDADSGIPVGFHRPTDQQPEALEAGGERFHSTEVSNPSFAGRGVRHGLTETGGISRSADMSHQVGKHASATPPRFLGTSLTKTATVESYVRERAREGRSSLDKLRRNAEDIADKGVKSVTKSPMAMGIAALLAARLGMRGLKGVGRGVKSLTRAHSVAHVPVRQPLTAKILQGAKRLINE